LKIEPYTERRGYTLYEESPMINMTIQKKKILN